MASDFIGPPSIYRYGGVAAVVLITLAAGVGFGIRGGSSATTYTDKVTTVVTCTGTGGLTKYAYCNWKEPSDNAGSGIVITSIHYIVGKSPVPIGVDIVSGCGAVLSGANLMTNFQDIQTSTGAIFKNTSGSILVTEGDYIRAITLSTPTSSHTASLVIEYITRLSR